jgi:hypothetical protein
MLLQDIGEDKGIRDGFKTREKNRIVARKPSPCVPLPQGEGIAKPLQLCSLSLWERVEVSAARKSDNLNRGTI